MFAAGRNSGALDFEAVEQATRDALHQAGASLIEMLLNDDAAYEPQQHCAWGGQARYAGKRAKKLVTMLGAIVVERPYDHCGHCGSGFAARDQELGVRRESEVLREEQAGELNLQVWETFRQEISHDHFPRSVPAPACPVTAAAC